MGPERLLNSSRLACNISEERPEWPPRTDGSASSAAHHIIPDREVQNVPLLRVAYDNNLYDFDGADNGVFLPTTPEAAAAARADPGWTQPTPIHNSGHHRYSDEVGWIAKEELDQFEELYGPIESMSAERIRELSPQINASIARINSQASALLTNPQFVINGVLQ